MRQATHALKSSSALLGAMRLSTRCEERESRGGIVPDAAVWVAAIEDLYQAVTVGLEAEAASLTASSSADQVPPRDPT
jgi:HPt (histidine-containing phosphotransfer) domain-containing protein